MSKLPNRPNISAKENNVAVIDIGSNSVRLVVYDGLSRSPLPIFNEKATCGLAEDIEATKQLNKNAIKLANQAIARLMQIISRMNINSLDIC